MSGDQVKFKSETVKQYKDNLEKIFEIEENSSQVVLNIIFEDFLLYTGKIISMDSEWCTVLFKGKYFSEKGVTLHVHLCALERIK